jgi:hypothetical protein
VVPLLARLVCALGGDEMRPRTFGDNACIDNLWFDPSFHARCFPNPIREVGKITACRCDWAGLRRQGIDQGRAEHTMR